MKLRIPLFLFNTRQTNIGESLRSLQRCVVSLLWGVWGPRGVGCGDGQTACRTWPFCGGRYDIYLTRSLSRAVFSYHSYRALRSEPMGGAILAKDRQGQASPRRDNAGEPDKDGNRAALCRSEFSGVWR